jgi:hypothetical protein
MAMPDVSLFDIDYEIEELDLCWSLWQLSDCAWPPPHPDELLLYPAGYMNALLAYGQGVSFHEDTGDRAKIGIPT